MEGMIYFEAKREIQLPVWLVETALAGTLQQREDKIHVSLRYYEPKGILHAPANILARRKWIKLTRQLKHFSSRLPNEGFFLAISEKLQGAILTSSAGDLERDPFACPTLVHIEKSSEWTFLSPEPVAA